MGKWRLLAVLSVAQFIMVIDTTMMNVAITAVTEDLNTTVGAVQAAITLYTLMMAVFMITGGKLAEKFGRKKVLFIGLIVYGIGSSITAMAPNINVLYFGWSFLEGLGAALMMPAMLSILTSSYKGNDRIKALGIIGAVAAVGAAVGPVVGGLLTTYLSWRVGFAAEAVICIFILGFHKIVVDNHKPVRERIDWTSSALSFFSMGLIVMAILKGNDFGWLFAADEGGIFGISWTPVMIALGSFLLYRLYARQVMLVKKGESPFINPKLLVDNRLINALKHYVSINSITAGILFVTPLFLQIVLGKNAIQSGMALVPLSITLLVLSFASANLSNKHSIKKLMRWGVMSVSLGLLYLLFTFDTDSNILVIAPGMALIGAGLGLTLPQLMNFVMSSSKESSQLSGLNYTAAQIGFSVGTALVGSVLMFALANSTVRNFNDNFDLSDTESQQAEVQIKANVEFVSNDLLVQELEDTELDAQTKDTIYDINDDSRTVALRASLLAMLVISAYAYTLVLKYPDKTKTSSA